MIFSRDAAEWLGELVAGSVSSVDSITPFSFSQFNQAIPANGNTTLVLPGVSTYFCLVNAAFAIRNTSSMLGIQVQGATGPQPYYLTGPNVGVMFPDVLFSSMVIREIAGVAGQWDLWMLGWRLDFTP